MSSPDAMGERADDVARFLSAHPPFDDLGPEEMEEVARSVVRRSFPAGSLILQQFATTSDYVYVVHTGSVEVIDQGEVVDVLEEGELMGHPSLLSGASPAFTVRAREDAACYLIPREIALKVFERPSGLGFLASNLRRRAARARPVRDAVLGDPRLVRAGSLVGGTPLECGPDVSVMEAARLMTRAGRSAVLVRTDGGYGIVTDSDLRRKVVAQGLSHSRPVRDVMTFPVRPVPADRLVHEVLLDMLEGDVTHVPIVDEGGNVVGVLSDLDILGLERRDPFDMRARIWRAGDPAVVAEIGRGLPASVATLARAGLDPEDVGHVVAVLVDALTTRLLELAVDELGVAPAPWAWLALGSEGRREQSLGADQDHALAYADGAEDHDGYFRQLAERVVEGLEACGIPRCPSRVLATEEAWRQSLSGWTGTLRDWMSAGEAKPVFLATIALDFRQIAGTLDAEGPLGATLLTAQRNPHFLWRLARLSTENRPPLGLRGNLILDRSDEERGVLDLKAAGILLVVDLARLFALEAGIGAKGTLERLRGAARAGTVDGETAEALEEAYRVFLDIRLDHQAAQIESGSTPDNLVEPSALRRMSRARLKDALRIVGHVQRELGRTLSAGRFR